MADDIGDISVDVIADMSQFEARLRARLKAVTEKVQARIKAQLDTTVARVQAVAFSKAVGRMRAVVGVGVNTAVAGARLAAWLARRPKFIELAVRINKASLVAAGAQIKALTGIGAVTGELQKFSNGIKGFFTNLPGLARTITLLTSIGAVGVHAFGALAISIASLGPAVQGLGVAILALPGILAGVGASIAAIVVAFKNAPQVVKDAAKSFAGLQADISDNFWVGAKTQTIDFLKFFGPAVKNGMAGVGAAVGRVIGDLASGLTSALGGGVIEKIFANIVAGADALRPAMAPLANIVSVLLQFGTSLLPAISVWLVKITGQFSAWLTEAFQTGKLNEMLATLGTWLQAAWSALKGFAGILTGIADAAANAGINGLFTGLEQIAAIVNSPAFQETLTMFFRGAASGSAGLLSALKPIGEMFSALMPTISSFIALAGNTLGVIFTELANAASQPIFQTGLSAFFDGILAFIRPLIPVIPIIVEKLAALATLAGTILSVLGPVFATAISALLPIFNMLLEAIGPVVEALGPVLSGVITALAPVLASLITAAQPFIDLIIALLPSVLELVQAIAAGLAPAFTQLAPVFAQLTEAILPVITTLLDILMPFLPGLIQLLGLLLTAGLQPLIYLFKLLGPLLTAISPVLIILGEVISAVIGTIVAVFTGDFASIGPIWEGVWNAMIAVWEGTIKPVYDAIATFFVGIWEGMVSGFKTNVAILTSLFTAVSSFISSTWNNLWSGVSSFFAGIWAGIGGIARGAMNGVLSTIEGFVNGAIGIINGLIGAINGVSGALGIPSIPKLGRVSLPRLAKGGTVLPRRGGTPVILGEGGRSEAVVDEGKLNKLLDAVLRAFPRPVSAMRAGVAGTRDSGPVLAAGGGTTNITNNFPVPLGMDPEEVAQEFVNRAAEKSALGGPN